ncbi:hypothetical protein [Chelatococcus albus]|uniref:hypothetical protein n=1 Tax=Chelatococcus albus TaxID=3047466 RepID=UPI0024BC46F0|nr:hypothetical protein [Chelatococcus sp. SYSU_G07232]
MLGLIACSLIAALGLAASGRLAREQPLPPAATVSLRLGDLALAVPAAWLRATMPAGGGPVHRLDLVLPWPNGAPSRADGGPAGPLGGKVLLGLVPAGRLLAGPDEGTRRHARFLAPAVEAGPGGLLRRRFREGSPYQGEEFFIAPPDERAFSARCGSISTGATPATCVSTLRVGRLDVELRFDPALLAQWRRLAHGAERAVAAISP